MRKLPLTAALLAAFAASLAAQEATGAPALRFLFVTGRNEETFGITNNSDEELLYTIVPKEGVSDEERIECYENGILLGAIKVYNAYSF
jgi:hypothetical protein